jgi:hypothetical protein
MMASVSPFSDCSDCDETHIENFSIWVSRYFGEQTEAFVLVTVAATFRLHLGATAIEAVVLLGRRGAERVSPPFALELLMRIFDVLQFLQQIHSLEKQIHNDNE